VEFTEELLDTMAGLDSNEAALQLAEALLAGREWRVHSNAPDIPQVQNRRRTAIFDEDLRHQRRRIDVAPPEIATMDGCNHTKDDIDVPDFDAQFPIEPRVRSNEPILLEFRTTGSLSDTSRATLLERYLGNNGSQSVLSPGSNSALDDATSDMLRKSLYVAVASFMNGAGTLASVQATLDQLRRPDGVLRDHPQVLAALPTTAKDAVACWSSQHAPAIPYSRLD